MFIRTSYRIITVVPPSRCVDGDPTCYVINAVCCMYNANPPIVYSIDDSRYRSCVGGICKLFEIVTQRLSLFRAMLLHPKRHFVVSCEMSPEHLTLFSILRLLPSIFGPLPTLSPLNRVQKHWSDNGSPINVFPLRSPTFQSHYPQKSLEDGHRLC